MDITGHTAVLKVQCGMLKSYFCVYSYVCAVSSLRTCRWHLFQPKALVTSLRETVTLFFMWVQYWLISQEVTVRLNINEGRWFMHALIVCVQVRVFDQRLLLCFSPGKSEQGLRPVGWHPLLDRKLLLSGWTRCGSHLRHPAGRVPGWESGPAQGGAGQWVATV